MGTISINSQKLFTLKPDGTELKELTYPGEWGKNRIGEYKKFEIEFSTTQPLEDSIIYFTPALFIDYSSLSPFAFGGIPTESYIYVVDSSATVGTYTMSPVVNPPYSPNLPKNWEVTIEIGYGDTFTIVMKFYHIQDYKGYFGTSNQYNSVKLLTDSVDYTSLLSVTGNSVYNTGKYGIKAYVYQVDPSDTSVFSKVETYFNQYAAGFYEKNETNTAPYFTNPLWIISDSTGVLTEISKNEDTKIDFYIDSASAPSDFYLWVIKTNDNNSSIDFFDNYDASFAEILDSGGSATINNKIKQPSQTLSLVSGSTYMASAYLDKSTLNVGDKYRFIGVVYDTTGFHVNSFISDEYEVTVPYFDGIGYDFQAKFRDYFNDFYGNNLTSCIEERIESRILFGYEYNAFKDDVLNRLGITLPDNDIRRYLTSIKVEIYEDASVQLRHYLDRVTAIKTGPTTYSTPSGMTLNFGSNSLEVIYAWRNRYESGVQNIESVFNNVSIIPGTSDQYWGGRNLKVKTTFSLYYDDYSIPFTDEIVFVQQLTVSDYRNTVKIYESGKDSEIDDENYYCAEDSNCFKAGFTTSGATDYRLIMTVEKEPGSIASIEENEELPGVLTQMDSDKFLSQETTFGQTTLNRASFCIDGTKFVYNNFYKLTAIAKKENP